MPKKRQLSPHKHRGIVYGAKKQFTPDKDTSPNLNMAGIRHVQGIVGALLYYACEVDNKLLMDISAILTHKSAATKCTASAIHQLLDCVATYSKDGIIYHASDMILCAHYNTAYLNESKARIRAGSFIFLSEDNPIPWLNIPVLTLAQIIKFFMSSSAKAELAGLLITSKNMIPLLQTLI